MSAALLVVVLVALVVLAMVGAAFWLSLALATKRPRALVASTASEVIDVLVPARGELSVVACVESVLAQTRVSVRVHVLVDDAEDPAAVALRSHALSARALDERVTLHVLEHTRKASKINAVLERLPRVGRVAILDADHVADPEWLARSTTLLDASDAIACVQGRRRPLELNQLFALWDSAQNHIGNECLDRARVRAGLPVFFTGTTALFRAGALAGGLGASLTEDTELSLRLHLRGARIVRLFDCGSREEVAPDVVSFTRRRRRWAAGHTSVFARGARDIWRHTSGRTRAGLAVHGVFYLVPALVLAVLFCLSAHLALQLRAEILLLSGALIVILALLLSRALTGAHRVVDASVAALWVTPHVYLALPWVLRRLGDEHAYFLVSFPYAKELDVVALVLALTPLLFLVVAHALVPATGWLRLALVGLSYPLMMWVDMVAITLGLVDAARGAREWPRIARLDEVKPRARWPVVVILVLTTLAVLVGHDLRVNARCAGGRTWVLPAGEIAMTLDVDRRATGDALELDLGIAASGARDVEWRVLLDGAPLSTWSQQARVPVRVPLGFRAHTLRVEARAPSTACAVERAFSSSHFALTERGATLNGEPFIIKGVVPSFQTAQTDLNAADGFAQVHALGANTVRLYHHAHARIAREAQRAGLMIIAQPDDTTWDNVSVDDGLPRELADKLIATERASAASPHVLFHLLGNEIELASSERDARVRAVREAIAHVRRSRSRPFSYGTFHVYLDYDVPLLAINMLDSGRTYWRGGLDALRRRGRPFFASELGGFVAFSERPPAALSAYRLLRQWRALESAGALGGVIFQSHDNWAQPVPGGLNDPFKREHPDDTRGLWSVDNVKTARVDIARLIFSDIIVDAPTPLVDEGETRASISVRNVRPYALRDIELRIQDVVVGRLAALGPNASAPVTLSALPLTGDISALSASFTTHRGLRGAARAYTGLYRASRAQVLARGLVDDKAGAFLAFGSEVTVVVPPDWTSAKVAGLTLGPGVHRLPVAPTRRALTWRWRAPLGVIEFPTNASGWLIIDGVGASFLELGPSADGPWTRVDAHAYRELVLPVDELPVRDGELYLRVQRDSPPFIAAAHDPDGVETPVVQITPWLFSPTRLILKR